MKRILFLLINLICLVPIAEAQPATVGIPLSIGRNRCGLGGGTDSVYFFNYFNAGLTRAVSPNAYRPRLKIGPASTTDRFSIFGASVSFNPKDQKMYYIWTDYAPAIPKSYIWRWNPDTTFTTVASPPAAARLDTFKSFNFDIGGVTFDNDGNTWQLEFSAAAPYKAYLRKLDFAGGIIGGADTLDLTAGAGGIGDTLYNVGSGDITLMPNGQMYFVFDNKLYTPDYGSYDNPTHHIKGTYIDTVRRPAGATNLVGLCFTDGDLIAAYSTSPTTATSCTYRKVNPITGDTAVINYTYGSNLGVRSVDMTQINSGVGASKRLISTTATGTPNQYNVVYDIYVKNYGNVPLSNVQIADNLASINGLANVSNVSATLTSNPAGVVLNPLYNGTTVTNLLNPLQALACYPAASNNFTIRITCRLSNILSGVIYNNSAVATANGFKNASLRDSSTNGANPDLNQNDKTDDAGEGQPTPLLIILTPTTPPCAVLSQVLYNQDFGTGNGMVATLPASPTASTGYSGAAVAPLGVNRFSVALGAQLPDPSNFVTLFDHTVDANGRMMVVNADAAARIIYADTMPVACPGQQYSLSFWSAFIGNASYQTVCDGLGGFKYPMILARIRDRTTGLVITQFTTDTIKLTSWQQLGMKWVMPPGYTDVIMELINAGPGGCGNDFALDDIQFGVCDPTPTVSLNNPGGTCLGSSVTFTGVLSDPAVLPGTKDYQWQWSPAPGSGPWTDVAGATSVNYTINPVAAADTGKYYRVIIAATGNMALAGCRYTSPGTRLAGLAPSIAPTSAGKNKNNICPGIAVTLSQVGGTLGTNANWRWYTGSPGGLLIGSGSTLIVNPSVTTTYYVRAEGDCNTSTDQAVTVFISCDIDKDNDGIPDFVESNMAAAFLDAPANGIINAYDPLTAGYVDYNNDYVNDNYQADGDSDNDGIPNYLDVTFAGRVDANSNGVDDRFDADGDGIINMLDLDSDNDGITDVAEAYGVDVNGDGLIDNFTDTDGDGLSDNVDANLSALSGASNTGLGLGASNINLDGDAVPNFLDVDSDNDGIPDVVETGGPDANNNGIIDGFVDVNTDGLHDGYINGTALLLTGTDGDANGRADTWPNKNLDRDLRPNAYDMDSDGDGIIDVIEAGLPDIISPFGVVDGVIGTNGWSASVSSLLALNLRNTDASGNPDYLDIDADDDGIPDNIEGMSTAGYIRPTSATDTDGDGLVNHYDNVVGFGGTGIQVYDHDGDAVPDYRDLDTDGDGSPDICEGNDWDLNGICDQVFTLTGLDTDGDGLDNRFDSLNSVTNIRGTSYMMGSGGSLTGDATPGTRATVQKAIPAQIDRDWRFVGLVLPVQFLNFSGVLHNAQELLSWSIIATKDIDHFEIERSLDNTSYVNVGIVTDAVKLNEQQRFGYTDDISMVSSDIIYYRLKVIGKAGEIKYSNVLVVRLVQNKTAVSIMPNPAHDYVTVRFFVEKESEVTIRIVDNIGKTVLVVKQKATKGNNTVQLNNLARYSAGVYSLQVLVNDEIVTNKLILGK